MNFLVWLVSFLIIFSKFLDCWTTSSQISNPYQEMNPRARKLFIKYGIQKTIWTFFVLSIIIVAISLWFLYNYYNSFWFKIFYVTLGLFIAWTQFAVAYTNKTRKLNRFTKWLLKKYNQT